jgi:hypothetical protein
MPNGFQMEAFQKVFLFEAILKLLNKSVIFLFVCLQKANLPF